MAGVRRADAADGGGDHHHGAPHGGRSADSNREYFLAGGNLTWPFIAGSIQLRALVSVLFLLGNVFIYLPIMLYTGALFLKSMFGVDLPIVWIAAAMAVMGAAYAIGGGLRAVAVYDMISGVGVLGMALLATFLALAAIDFDFSGIPPERLSMIGGPESPIPWPTLLTGMIFIQMFYWSTNQTITQRAMAAPSIREGQKGVLAAVVIRILIVPAVVVLPGVAAYKLFGDIGDATYGRVVAPVMPGWLSGAFAAFMLLSIALVPMYAGADSIINLVQQLNGLLSMPILSVFIVGLLFTDVDARAMMAALLFSVGLYGVFTILWTPVHYIHLMLVTLAACIAMALTLNRLMFARRARWAGRMRSI